jgi:uncharacterized protein
MGNAIPNRAGVGYKPRHFEDIMENTGHIGWLEIHAENYMGDGGRPIAQLKQLRELLPISCHGVGLSIGAEGPLDTDHLARLKHLMGWLSPDLFSEHLAWSTHDGHFLNDLLPLPLTQSTLTRVVAHIDQVQEILGRQMLLENPSSYCAFEQSDMTEVAFLSEVAQRTGCGLLLDVNNVYVSATNLHYNPLDYIDAFPLQYVEEVHLGGHTADTDENEQTLLIDDHADAVTDPVWELYEYTLKQSGPRPTLIEWDTAIPEWDILAGEARQADAVLAKATAEAP